MGIQSLSQDLPESLWDCHRITIAAKSVVAKVTATNLVPHSLAPNVENKDMLKQLEDGQHQDQENVNCCSTCEVPKLTPEKENCYLTKFTFQVLTVGILNLLKRLNNFSVNNCTHIRIRKFRCETHINGET